MYQHTDCFISYNDDFIVKQEKLSDSDTEAMPKPYPLDSSSPLFVSPKKPRAESFVLQTIQKLVSTDFLAQQNKKKPFIIIRGPKRFSEDPIKVKLEPEKKLMDNNRKEHRRRRTKKQDVSRIIVKEEAGTEVKLEEGLIQVKCEEIGEQGQKKMVQMIRNRISAQNSRDRRKMHMQSLEEGKDVLAQENQRLWSEKTSLLKEVLKLEQSNNKLMAEREKLLKKKKKKSEKLTCVTCSKNSQETSQAGFSKADLDDLWKNVGMIGGQEDFSGLSEEQRELGFSIGISMGMAMIECMKGSSEDMVKVKSLSHGSRKTEACTAFEGEFEEEEDFFFGRKFSRSTLASPNLSSLTQGSFISEDYELNKPALTSFWDSVNMMNEGKIMEKGEKKFSIDFQKKVMMENVIDGGALKQRTSPLAAKGGSVRLLNGQEF
jgi:hypothetical protein